MALNFSFPDIEGDHFTDEYTRLIYATDASAYREVPAGVVWPRNQTDIKKLIEWSANTGITLIPRGAGTSLAGQVVGNGLVVDVSRHMTQLLEINPEEKWVRVEPGIVLDELNLRLKQHKLFFAPETSTSNRCTIGGMIGNNSAGIHSLIYGTTREHILSVTVLLSDGSEVEFSELDETEFHEKINLKTLEGEIYRQINNLLGKEKNRAKVAKEFPDPKVIRRNTGYALDELMNNCVFSKEQSSSKFNFCKLLAGSEGTLAFITSAKLKLISIPETEKALLCVHFQSVKEAIRANLIALKYSPAAVELMDNKILELTRENIEQRKNRFFVSGEPGAILIIELIGKSFDEILTIKESLENELRNLGLGYHFPMVSGEDIKKVWNLRKAGLGILSNLPGDSRPVSVIEDTSVKPSMLERYIDEFNLILEDYELECVYHAHISVGELHLRPILNLKDPADVVIFQHIAEDIARLVKKYRGSLSGEHGDGRLRGSFIPIMVGEEIFSWFKEIKNLWDKNNTFNANKIIDTPPMNTSLRYNPGEEVPVINTIFDFEKSGGFLRAIEKCNGSGDCRKSELMGGTMCPSYMATRDENTTTRARANILREYIRNSTKRNPLDHKEIYNVLDLCLSCKGCKSECPSNVDMAKYKSEFLQNYYDNHWIPLRVRMISYITSLNKLGSIWPGFYNFMVRRTGTLIKKLLGFAQQRSLPLLHNYTLRSWCSSNLKKANNSLGPEASEVILFVDEFSNYNDTNLGVNSVNLLLSLGYKVQIAKNVESGRTFISKGLLRTARKKAIINILLFRNLISDSTPLVGIEPSAILSFRDEYPDLVRGELKKAANNIARNTFTIEEFLCREMKAGKVSKELFTKEKREIKLHGHCQQKSISTTDADLYLLSFPEYYTVKEIPSGCCGMAGSFGYEKEHYDLSMKVGELILFPEIRKSSSYTLISAPGTSCRQQIKDGTGREAFHPVDILFDALIKKTELH